MSDAPFRRAFDNARDPYTARNALGITSPGGGAPATAQYITAAADPTLTAERVLTNTATITWDFSTAGQAKASTAAGGGNVSNSGTPTVGQYGKWVTATTIQGVAPATVLSDIGAQPAGNYQPLDGELTAIAGLTSAADQAPYFTGSGAAALMTVTAAARTVLDDTTTAAMLTTMGGLSSATAAATYQPLDGDLTSLAAAAGTNTIYYRNAANSWAAVTVSTGLSFSGGVLTATGGGGDVFKASANTFTAQNCFINVGVVVGNTAAVLNTGLETHGLTSTKATISLNEWANDATGPNLILDKSRGATVGSYTAVAANDVLGEIYFRGSTGSAFGNSSVIRATAALVPIAGVVPGAIELYVVNNAGALILCGSISAGACNFVGNTGANNAPTGCVGEYLEAVNTPGSALPAGSYSACNSISVPPGDWDIRGTLHVSSGTVQTAIYAALNTTAGAGTNSALATTTGSIGAAFNEAYISVGPWRFLTSTTQTIWLNCYPQNACTLTDSSIQLRRRH